MSWITEPTLDWTRSETQELLNILVAAYDREPDAVFVATLCGIDTSKLAITGILYDTWINILEQASKGGLLSKVIDHLIEDKSRKGFHERAKKLLSMGPGLTALTRMLRPASSRARTRVMVRSAALVEA